MFLNNDVFYFLNEEIDKMDVDIIKYRSIESINSYNPFKYRMKLLPSDFNENRVLYQPDLGKFEKWDVDYGCNA